MGRGVVRRLITCCAVVVVVVDLGGCASSPRPVSSPAAEAGLSRGATPRWQVALLPGVDVDVGVVVTRLCFDGPPPPRVGPEHRAALRHLADLPRPVDATGQVLGPPLPIVDDGAHSGIDTSTLPPGACVAFDVDVEAAARAIDQRDVAAAVGRALLISPDVWLWRPKPWPARVGHGTLVVDDPTKLAAPFARAPDGAFVVRSSTFALQSYTALGAFPSRQTRSRRGVDLDVVRLATGGVDDVTLGAWLDVAIDDVAVPLGRFPVPQMTLLVVPLAGARPILGGFLGRGGGASAMLLVGDDVAITSTTGEDVDDDAGRWVLTHELAHALLPPVVRADAWFNEGLTTWHQEVLPAAAGRRGRDVAAAQLGIGLRTGARRARQDGLPLARACAEMDRFGSYQHCYWGGAGLVQLLADDVGDDGVVALVRAVQGLGPIDAAPQTAAALLLRVEQTAKAKAARRAATRLLALWRAHKDGLFPDVAAARAGDGL